MRCHQCGSENVPGASFCAMCGVPIGAQGASPYPYDSAPAAQQLNYVPGTPIDGSTLVREELAGWWQRLGGAVLDGIIFFGVMFIPIVIFCFVLYGQDPLVFEDGHTPNDAAFVVIAFGALLYLIAYALWNVLWVRSARMGKPGQRICGYVVSDAAGERIGTGRSIGRFAASFIYNLSYLGYVLGVVSAFTIGMSQKRQGLHDMIASTLCVRREALTRRGLGPDAIAGAMPAYGTSIPVMHVPMGVPGSPQPLHGSGQAAPPGAGPFLP